MHVSGAMPAQISEINAVIEAAKRTWDYSPDYVAAALPFLRVDREYILTNACFVAEDDGAVAGFAALLLETGGTAILDHLWVVPAMQRCGVGSVLLERCVLEARPRASVLRVYADPPSRGFYERLGAVLVGSKPSRIEGGPEFPVLEFRL